MKLCPADINEKSTSQNLSISGGQGWIRTIEVVDGRFTVCSLWPLGNLPIYKKTGAGGRTRTPDLLITNQLLYQLSYTSISTCERLSLVSTLEYNTTAELICQAFFSIFFSFFLLIFYLPKKSLSAHLKEAEPPLDMNGSASWRLF